MNCILARTRTHLLALFCLLSPLLVPHSRGDALNELQRRNPPPSPDSLSSVGFGGGVFIAADDRGDVFTSPDGLTWTTTGSVSTNVLSRIAYGSGRFVAFSTSGNLLSSENGSVWTVRASATNVFQDIIFANGLFVIVGTDRTMTSADGINWSANMGALPVVPFTPAAAVAYGNGLFAVVRNSSAIYTSPDGVAWTTRQPNSGYLWGTAISYGNGYFLVSGVWSFAGQLRPRMWAFTNDSNAVALPDVSLRSWNQFLFDGSKFIGTYFTNIYTTVDGTNWPAANTPFPAGVRRMVYGNGVYLAISYSSTPLLRSLNGTDWTAVSIASPDRIFSTFAGAYAAGRYVLIGPHGVVTSTDGINFTRDASAPKTLNGITTAGGQFAAVGLGGGIFLSSDGLAWSFARSGTVKTLYSIAHGAGRYVAVGLDGAIRVSLNGIVWGGAWSGTDYTLNAVAFGNGQFVVVGIGGIILTSPDGAVWTPQANPSFSALNQVVYGGGKFVAVGANGTVLTSVNGTDWTVQAPLSNTTLQRFAYGDGLYVGIATNGLVFSSTDGTAWQPRTDLGLPPLAGSTFMNDRWFVMGSGGTIYGTAPAGTSILSAATNPGTGNFEVKVTSDDIGATYRLQSCTNLQAQTWSDVTSFIQTQPVTTVIVPGGVGAPQCFYRTVTP